MKRTVLKIALACTVAVTATVGIYVYSLYDKTTVALEKIGTPEVVPVEESAKVKPLTLLLMGVDYRPELGSLNSDVLMVVTLNPDNDSATLVSLPRDLQMEPKGLPSRKANYYYPYFNNQDKSSAFAETKKVFSDFMGVPIDYMLTVDFDGFRQVVDLMGGLTLEVDMDMRYVDDEDGTDINLKKGIAKLNGKQTLDFVRYRKSNRNTAESSDLARNQRQQQVLDELLNSLKSAGGIAKLGQIIETVGNHLKTDVPSTQLRDLMTTYYNISPSNVNYIHLDGAWESPYVVVKDEDIEQARTALRLQLGDTATAIAGIAPDEDSAGTGRTVGGSSGSVTGSKSGGSTVGGSSSSGTGAGGKSTSAPATSGGRAAGDAAGANAGSNAASGKSTGAEDGRGTGGNNAPRPGDSGNGTSVGGTGTGGAAGSDTVSGATYGDQGAKKEAVPPQPEPIIIKGAE
jgi:LCP family protein required for cell wall assembly